MRGGERVRASAPAAIFDDAFGQDDESHVADDGHSAPGHGRGPEGGVVGDTAADGGEVGVCGGEEVEGYARGEDFGREGGGEEGGEAVLEDAEGWVGDESGFCDLCCEGVGRV